MNTSNVVATHIIKNYGFRFFKEYCKWRRIGGYGMREALNRIRTAHAKGFSPIG